MGKLEIAEIQVTWHEDKHAVNRSFTVAATFQGSDLYKADIPFGLQCSPEALEVALDIKLLTAESWSLRYNLCLVGFFVVVAVIIAKRTADERYRIIMSVSDEHNRASFAMGAFIFMQIHNMQIDTTSCFHASSDPIRRFEPSGRKPDFALGEHETVN